MCIKSIDYFFPLASDGTDIGAIMGALCGGLFAGAAAGIILTLFIVRRRASARKGMFAL